jgi:hypothetical protein
MAARKNGSGKKKNGTDVTLLDLHREIGGLREDLRSFKSETAESFRLMANAITALTDNVSALGDRVDVLTGELHQTNLEMRAQNRRIVRVEERTRKLEQIRPRKS